MKKTLRVKLYIVNGFILSYTHTHRHIRICISTVDEIIK